MVNADLEKISNELLASKKYDAYVELTESAFNENTDEDQMAQLVGAIYEKNISNGFWLIEAFVNQFPGSLHLIRIFLSDLWARQENFDSASNEARIYLWMLKDSGFLTKQINNPILLEGALRAHLLLTAVYTEAGARSYSTRVLQESLKLNLSEKWRINIEKEINSLLTELDDSNNKYLDDQWEAFFNTGKEWDRIDTICTTQKLEHLRKRCELINNNYLYNSAYKVDANEIYMLVHQVEEDTFALY